MLLIETGLLYSSFVSNFIIEIDEKTQSRLKKLSKLMSLSESELVSKSVEQYEQKVFMDQVVADFENLKLQSGEFQDYVNDTE